MPYTGKGSSKGGGKGNQTNFLLHICVLIVAKFFILILVLLFLLFNFLLSCSVVFLSHILWLQTDSTLTRNTQATHKTTHNTTRTTLLYNHASYHSKQQRTNTRTHDIPLNTHARKHTHTNTPGAGGKSGKGGKGDGGKGKGGKSGGKGKGGKGKGGKGGKGGMKGGAKVTVVPHRNAGVFVAKGKDDALCTKNLDPGNSVYGEKRVAVEEGETKVEYRVWNPFRSKLAAAIVGGVEDVHIVPGAKLLYLGAASGTTVSHCSDIVGPEGLVYAVEFSARPGRDLINVAKRRTNIIPIVEDARYPLKYRMLVGMVDVIFADVAQPDQARIVGHNASYFLKNGGHFVISIKVPFLFLFFCSLFFCLPGWFFYTTSPPITNKRHTGKLRRFNSSPRSRICQ